VFSLDVHVARAPNRTYHTFISDEERLGVWRMLRRPLIVALVIGTAVPIMAVQRVTVGLLVSSALSFSFVVAIQMAVGAAIIATRSSRHASMLRALDLWFAGHVPYSLWLLTVAATFASMPAASMDLLFALAVIPAVWTAVIVAAFCRQVLGASPAGARWRAALHCVAIWAIGFELVALSAGGWFQVYGPIQRMFQ
jgi:hypothetical protein